MKEKILDWFSELKAYVEEENCSDIFSVPSRIYKTESGWMNSATFYEYIANVFYPQLLNNNVKFPVLILFDGHKSHINIDLHDFCVEKNILLYCLLPNATHLIQPCDVGIFRPLKIEWKKAVTKHQQTSTQAITKLNFAPIFATAFNKSITPEIIKRSFECCGLYPFNANRIDFSKCISTRRAELECQEELDNQKEEDLITLTNMEKDVPTDLLASFQKAYKNNTDATSEILLFNIWRKKKREGRW